jgi:hypothetical protein
MLLAGGVAAAPRAKWVDRPAWPAGDTLELTWVVKPGVPTKKDPDIPKAPLELHATMGGTTRKITLAPQQGALYPYNQPVCAGKTGFIQYPLAKNQVAKITFYEGGAGGYFVRRTGDVLEVVAWEQPDGACDGKNGELVACPGSEVIAFKLHVPKSVKIREAIVELDANGARTPLACTDS